MKNKISKNRYFSKLRIEPIAAPNRIRHSTEAFLQPPLKSAISFLNKPDLIIHLNQPQKIPLQIFVAQLPLLPRICHPTLLIS